MKTQIYKRQNRHTIVFDNGDMILVSYQTPVAACVKGIYYRTSEHYSTTTTKHINSWIYENGQEHTEEKPPEFFTNLLKYKGD